MPFLKNIGDNMVYLKKRKAMGILAVAGASLLFGTNYSMGRAVQMAGMSETCNGLWTALMAIGCNLLYCRVKKRRFFARITRAQLLLCILCGAVSVWLSGYMFQIAYRYLTVSETTMLHFLHPSLIAVFMAVVFKEHFSFAKAAAIAFSVGGMAFISGGAASGAALGIAAAVLSGVFYAVYAILLEKSSLRDVEGTTVVLYMNIASALSALCVSLACGKFSLPVSSVVWMCDAMMAVSSFFAYLLTCYAIHALGATLASFGGMLEPIASCLLSAVIYRESMSMNVLYGSVLTVASVVLCSMGGMPRARKCSGFPHKGPE